MNYNIADERIAEHRWYSVTKPSMWRQWRSVGPLIRQRRNKPADIKREVKASLKLSCRNRAAGQWLIPSRRWYQPGLTMVNARNDSVPPATIWSRAAISGRQRCDLSRTGEQILMARFRAVLFSVIECSHQRLRIPSGDRYIKQQAQAAEKERPLWRSHRFRHAPGYPSADGRKAIFFLWWVDWYCSVVSRWPAVKHCRRLYWLADAVRGGGRG